MPEEHDGSNSTGLRALVTGGGSGIGAAIAARLKHGGAAVVIVDVDPATSPDVVADVADTAAVDELFADVREALGGLDVLVNNVGVAGPTARCRRDGSRRLRRVRAHQPRLDVPVHTSGGAAAARAPGSIVNISSSAGHLRLPAALAVRRGQVGAWSG